MIETVLWGANNIYTTRSPDGTVHRNLRIKGKILGDDEGDEYNPLAPGDLVALDDSQGTLLIVGRQERRNRVARWNRKRWSVQVVAANVDLIYLVTSTQDPPYRAAFIDRVLVMAELEGIPAALVVNKSDYPAPEAAQEHMKELQRQGYPVLHTVATADGLQIDDFRRHSTGKTSVLFGQSGVGKSSLVNALIPAAELATGTISHKYSRGRHTTTLARQVVATDPALGGAIYIDTPGVREFDLFGYACTDAAAGFREFQPLIPSCRMPGCTHTHEPDCSVREALKQGTITHGRYQSYCRIAADLQGEGGR